MFFGNMFGHIWKQLFLSLIRKEYTGENVTMYRKNRNSGFYQKNVI